MSIIHRAAGFGLVLAASTAAERAVAQQYNDPWQFTPQSRAQIAIIMRQEESRSGGAVSGVAGAAGPGGGTTIVCSGGAATAQGNNTCIILNNSDGMISTDQDSTGDQSASSAVSGTVNGETVTGADEVLSALTGN